MKHTFLIWTLSFCFLSTTLFAANMFPSRQKVQTPPKVKDQADANFSWNFGPGNGQ